MSVSDMMYNLIRPSCFDNFRHPNQHKTSANSQ